MKTEVSIKKNVDKGKYVTEKQNNNYRHILIKLQKLYGSFSTPNALTQSAPFSICSSTKIYPPTAFGTIRVGMYE
jgi:hypothetical protein